MRQLIDDYCPTFSNRWQVRWVLICQRFRWWPWVTRARLFRTDAYWSNLLDRERSRYVDEICRLRRELLKKEKV
jgi:hypothetical protein